MPINDSNKDDILGNGVFSYDSSSNILNIGGIYTALQNDVIAASKNDLRITYVNGSELQCSNGRNALYILKNTTLYGSGALKLHGLKDNAFPIYVNDCNLTIGRSGYSNGTVYADGATQGIHGYMGATLTLNDANVRVRGDHAAIQSFSGISLTDCVPREPEGAYVTSDTILGSDEVPVKYCSIERLINYGIRVAGTEVTNFNCDDILGNGKFAYDESCNRLYIKGSCTAAEGNLIELDVSCDIFVEDNVTLTASNGDCIYWRAAFTSTSQTAKS